MEKRTSLAF